MNYRVLGEEEFDSARYWAEEAGQIRRRSQVALEYLTQLFKSDGEYSHLGISFKEPESENSLVLLESPVARGRVRLDFSTGKAGLVGKWVVEREGVTATDARIWTEVWVLSFSKDDEFYVQHPGDGTKISFRSSDSRIKESNIAKLGMSIYYALVAGPIVSEAA